MLFTLWDSGHRIQGPGCRVETCPLACGRARGRRAVSRWYEKRLHMQMKPLPIRNMPIWAYEVGVVSGLRNETCPLPCGMASGRSAVSYFYWKRPLPRRQLGPHNLNFSLYAHREEAYVGGSVSPQNPMGIYTL